jgi:hypothetical protein
MIKLTAIQIVVGTVFPTNPDYTRNRMQNPKVKKKSNASSLTGQEGL